MTFKTIKQIEKEIAEAIICRNIWRADSLEYLDEQRKIDKLQTTLTAKKEVLEMIEERIDKINKETIELARYEGGVNSERYICLMSNLGELTQLKAEIEGETK